jgi:CO dehydrogenase nickel-insertion accessory protein CooC1
VACYHSKTGAVELYLNHLIDGPGEYVVVDCTAGADSFASGLFTRFDLTVLVAEPTRKGISVYRQWQDYSGGYDTALALVGNKVQGPEDVSFLREHAAGDLLTCFGYEAAVRAMEQGCPFSSPRPSARREVPSRLRSKPPGHRAASEPCRRCHASRAPCPGRGFLAAPGACQPVNNPT